MMTPYFAYGANLDLSALPDRGVKIQGYQVGQLYGWKLVFNVLDDEHPGAGFANLEPCPTHYVTGLVYHLDDRACENLDRYEDVPRDYQKRCLNIQVTSKLHQTPKQQPILVPCLVYLGQRDRTRATLKPQPQYLFHFVQGSCFLAQSHHPCRYAINIF